MTIRFAQHAAPTADEDGDVCLHTEIEPYEDEPTRGACVDCGEEFGRRASPADADEAAEEETAAGGVTAESVAATNCDT